jgi:mono/diheme cytochrome c family protein
MKQRDFASLLLAAALGVTIAACSNNGNSANNAATSTEASEPAAMESAAPGATASGAPVAMETASTAPEAMESGGAPAAPAGGAPPATAGAMASPAADGAKIYAADCSSCHQASGLGAPGAFPPLANNPTVTGDPRLVIHIVKYGLTGSVHAGGQTFNGMMPPWGTQLSDAGIAAVVSYIRSSWGNAGAAVTADDVAAVKQ